MRIPKILSVLLAITLLAWGIEAIYISNRNASAPSRIRGDEETRRTRITAEFKERERELDEAYERKKYLATGETVYDRIFNTQNQTVIELISRVAREALPDNWSCEVQVEGFTHFILLTYPPHNAPRVEPRTVASYFPPILRYCGWCVSDVAVFDRTRKSYLFFDRAVLDTIMKGGNLTTAMASRARQQGKAFTRFNSRTIQCEAHNSHLYLPIEVKGPNGITSCRAMLDTGASMTMLAKTVVEKTGIADFSSARRERFRTANGVMSCWIVRREVNIGECRRDIEVGVSERGMNLLGVNFFEGMGYVVDFQNSCIYVWERPRGNDGTQAMNVRLPPSVRTPANRRESPVPTATYRTRPRPATTHPSPPKATVRQRPPEPTRVKRESPRPTVKQKPRTVGTVAYVNNDNGIVIVNLLGGASVSEKDVVGIYRADRFVGWLKILVVDGRSVGGEITDGSKPRIGDEVRSRGQPGSNSEETILNSN